MRKSFAKKVPFRLEKVEFRGNKSAVYIKYSWWDCIITQEMFNAMVHEKPINLKEIKDEKELFDVMFEFLFPGLIRTEKRFEEKMKNKPKPYCIIKINGMEVRIE
jgi:hypothetical protein